MAEYSPLSRPGENTAYDPADFQIELTALPKSRAPSYTTISSSLFRFDTSDGKDDERLLSYSTSHFHPEPSRHSTATKWLLSHRAIRAFEARRQRLQGWHFGVAVSAWLTLAVLVTNLILTVAGAASYPLDDGIGTAMDGNCGRIDSAATWLHLLINALSSILLSASNYTMQCVAAPTRTELDRAHAKGTWMNIGVSSIRNLFLISWRRVAVWWILFLSTVPIHLLFNSAVFKTLDANKYVTIVANTGFFERGPNANFSTTVFPGPFSLSHNAYATKEPVDPTLLANGGPFPNLRHVQNLFATDSAYLNTSAFQNLTNDECIAAYGTNFISGRDDVIAVTSDAGNSENNTLFTFSWTQATDAQFGPSYTWICTDDTSTSSDLYYWTYSCDSSRKRKTANEWTIGGKKIDYCLSHVQPSHCKLQFSTQILAAVIICNALKSAAMFYTLYTTTDETLVTVGDAVASYLDNPDNLTAGRCLMAKKDVRNGPLRWGRYGPPNRDPPPAVTYHESPLRRWFTACSPVRWWTTILLCTTALATSGFLLGLGVSHLASDAGVDFMTLAFGGVDARAMIDIGLPTQGSSGLISQVLLANLPQAILSLLYIMYNGLYTLMCLSQEWSLFAVHRQPLRVTTPRGQQWSTYYLQLPYWYGAPLIVLSGIMHWLVSESIFLARISVWAQGRPDSADDISSTGYSCKAIVAVIVIGIAMLLVAIGMGFRKFASRMPVAGSCSAAIAAACHRPKSDVDAAFRPVKWGEVIAEGTNDVGHCSFTSDDVHDLIPGRAYAGSSSISVDGKYQNNRRRRTPNK